MSLFGPPDVKKLEDQRNVEGLIRLLSYQFAPRDVNVKWQTEAEKQAERIRGDAAAALGRIGDARAVDPLIGVILRDKNYFIYERNKAMEGLANIRDARAVEPLIVALRHKNEDLHRPAIQALGKIGDTRAVKPLITILTYKLFSYDYLYNDVVEALGLIGNAEAVEPLVDALDYDWRSIRNPYKSNFDDNSLRKKVVVALGKIGDPRAINPLASFFIKDDYRDYRSVAEEALRMLKWQPDNSESGAAYFVYKHEWGQCITIGAPAVNPLISAIKNHFTRENEIDVIKTLGKIGDVRAVEPLLTVLKEKYEPVFAYYEEGHSALDNIRDMKHKQETVLLRQTAIEVLKEFCDKDDIDRSPPLC